MAINYYTDTSEDTIDSEELALYNLINQYRAQNGLPAIPLSKALTIVASRHVLDTVYNVGSYAGHSWSDAPYDGNNSATYPNMWEAPQRLNTGYSGNGYEITTGFTGTSVTTQDLTAPQALQNWQGSTPHDNVILNKDIWTQLEWKSIGVAIHKGISHVWFGSDVDPTGTPAMEGGSSGGGSTGNAGNDTLQYVAGTTNIDMGDGTDTLVINEARGGRTPTDSGSDKQITIGSTSVTLSSVERLQFTDGTLALDTGVGENAGQAYRVYQAAFARTPDNDGLKFWIGQVDSGTSLIDVARGFLASAEAQGVYGANPANGDFVAKLYQNVLGRDGEAGGITFWVGELDGGSRTQAQVLADFSESPENVSGVSPVINDGIFYV